MNDEMPYKVLIIEDNPEYAEPLRDFLDATKLFTILGVTDSATQAYRMIKTGLPDAIVFDLQLAEGDGLVLLEQLRDPKEYLPVVPYILVLTEYASGRTMKMLRRGLADFVITKDNTSYHPKMIYKHLRLARQVFHRNQTPEPPMLDDSLEIEHLLRARITSELDQYYMSQSSPARGHLAEVLFRVVHLPQNEKFGIRKIYADLGKELQTNPQNINVGISRLLQAAFSKTDPDTLKRLYSQYVDPTSGSPGAKEFVAYTANKIRKEQFRSADADE